MKIKKLWKRCGVIVSNGAICWTENNFDQQLLLAKKDLNACGYVTEKKVLFADGSVKSLFHYFFFGRLVDKEYVFDHFSQTPGFDDWLKGYAKEFFILVHSLNGKRLFKILPDRKISFVVR